MEKLNNLVQAAVAFQERMKTEGEAALKEAFIEFFTAHSEIGEIRWRQYTPYFNDGDACTFARHEFEFIEQGGVGDGDEDDDDDGDGSGCRREMLSQLGFYLEHPQYGKGRILTVEEQTQLDAYNAFEKVCGRIDELFETVFGDHVEVTATQDGFTVEEYDHD